MARYRGTVVGGRGEASRLGHATTGLRVTAQSYSGDITITFNPLLKSNGDLVDEDWCCITARPHRHSGSGYDGITLYNGPIGALLDSNGQDRLILELAERKLAELGDDNT